MTKKKNIPQDTLQETAGTDWKSMLHKFSYANMIHHIPYVSFVVFLCVLYITHNQNSIETQRRLNKKTEELKELRWRYMDMQSRLMNAGMETEIIKKAAILGLKPLEQPVYKIQNDVEKIQHP